MTGPKPDVFKWAAPQGINHLYYLHRENTEEVQINCSTSLEQGEVEEEGKEQETTGLVSDIQLQLDG